MQPLREQDYIQQLSIDCVIFGYEAGELKVLVPRMDFRGDFWALPGGYILQKESIDEAAYRILKFRTGISDIFLEQFWVFGNQSRSSQDFIDRLLALNTDKLEHHDLRDYAWLSRRFVSIGYYALVDMHQVKPQISELDASIEWMNVRELPPLIMDHNAIVAKALETLRTILDQKLIGFNLLPETFTMKEVQQLYEAIFDKPLARNNFQKKMLDLQVLERLEKKFTGAANKAPYLYRLVR